MIELMQMFPLALAGGVLIAAVCAVLGVFVILKRVVFIGITLSEVAACGIASALVLGLPPYVGAVVLTVLAVALLAYPFEMRRIPRDAVLGVMFVLAGAASILLVAHSGFGLHEIKTLLYGDLILISGVDLAVIGGVLVPVLAGLLLFRRPVLYTFLDRDAARVMGIRVGLWEALYFLALGLVVAAAGKVAGAMLVFCYLVVAPATALLLSRRLWLVLLLAGGMAVAATLGGIYWSFSRDLPTNQTIALVACIFFIIGGAGNVLCAKYWK